MPNRYSRYGYYPERYRPKGNYPAEVLMGMELEIEGYEDTIIDVVREVDASHEHLFIKPECSIDGLEIVTEPMTLNWAKTYPFDDLLDKLRAQWCSYDEGCGLHVHVSRNAFRRNGKPSASHQMAWLMLLYRNTEALIRLGRRESEDWASFYAPRKGELKRKAQGDRRDDRYRAVNCTNNRTYELRFFEATLFPQEMWAALEFADASVEYTRQLRSADVMHDNGLAWDEFITWCEQHGDKYKNLIAEAG